MADTLQAVTWTLAQSCALRRDGPAVTDPVGAIMCVRGAQLYSRYRRRREHGFGIFGDVCVTSHTSATVPAGVEPPHAAYPCGGFVIRDEFAPLGGADRLVAMCASCPANTSGDDPAGCAGSFYESPGSAQLQRRLERIIARHRLRREFADYFLPTTPLWYGLWARSPLCLESVMLLRILIRDWCDVERAEDEADADAPYRQHHFDDLRAFVRAAGLAQRHGLDLHVRLAPPGHTDLGYVTTFPHCPVCKAMADVQRWQRQYPKELHRCRACGHEYSPAETASSVRDDEPWGDPDLRETLGGERFVELAKRYLVAHHVSPSAADAITAATEAREDERRREAERERDRLRLQDRYVREVLFRGFQPHYPEGDDVDPIEPSAAARFDAGEFARLLDRCHAIGIKVQYMVHESASPDLKRIEWTPIWPRRLLKKWIAQGCREEFGAGFKVRDEQLDAFGK